MSVTVYLANQGFILPARDLDDRRREAYFKNPADPNNQLMPEEIKILRALGIDKKGEECLRKDMPQFFHNLPKCQSDASLNLLKDCEIVQYVLWQTLLQARTRSETMYNENQRTTKPLANISVAINKQIIDDLKPKPDSLNDIDRLFTLLMKSSAPVVSPTSPTSPTSQKPSDADKLFTLILKNQQVPPSAPPAAPTPLAVPTPPSPPSPPSPETDPSVVSSDTSPPNLTTIVLERPLEAAGRDAAQAIVLNQCGGKAVPEKDKDRQYETVVENHKRSIYFWYCIKNKSPIDLEVGSLSEEQEKQFVNEWAAVLENKEDRLEASKQFLDINGYNDLNNIEQLYVQFEKGGPNGSFLKCYGCNKIGEAYSRNLGAFTIRIGLSPIKLQYFLENAQWNTQATEAAAAAPKTVDEIGLFIMDKTKYDLDNVYETWFTIVTNHDVDYSTYKGKAWNYSLQGKHIHEAKLVHDLFRYKKAVLDIHPWLLYLLDKERYVERPTVDGSKRSINEWFLKNAFDGNHSPVKDPRFSLTKRLYPSTKEQLNVAYYVICHAIANSDPSYIPASFYSNLTYNKKLPLIVGWLRDKNTDYKLVEDAMRWAVPGTKPLGREELAKLFTKSGKQTLKNKYNASNRSKSWAANVKALMEKFPGAAAAPVAPVAPVRAPVRAPQPEPEEFESFSNNGSNNDDENLPTTDNRPLPLLPPSPSNTSANNPFGFDPSQNTMQPTWEESKGVPLGPKGVETPAAPKKGFFNRLNLFGTKKKRNAQFRATVNRARNSGMSAVNAIKMAEEEQRAQQTATPVALKNTRKNVVSKSKTNTTTAKNKPKYKTWTNRLLGRRAPADVSVAAPTLESQIQNISTKSTLLLQEKAKLEKEFETEKAKLTENISTKGKDYQRIIISKVKNLRDSKNRKQRILDIQLKTNETLLRQLRNKQTDNLISRAPKVPTDPVVLSQESSSDPAVRARNTAVIAEDRRGRSRASSNNASSLANSEHSVTSNVNAEGGDMPLSADNKALLRELNED